MPLRAPKMYGFIFGFQRLVWWPKWTPASRSWRMVMPCAGAMACAISAAGGGGVGVLGCVWTFSDIVFLLHLRRARVQALIPREPCPDREVCVVNCLGRDAAAGVRDLAGSMPRIKGRFSACMAACKRH